LLVTRDKCHTGARKGVHRIVWCYLCCQSSLEECC